MTQGSMFTFGFGAELVGYNRQSGGLEPPFDLRSLSNLLPIHVRQFSIKIGSAFQASEMKHVDAILNHTVENCGNLSSVYFGVNADTWNRDQELYNTLLAFASRSFVSLFHLRIVEPQRTLTIDVIKSSSDVSTTARLSLDDINDTVLEMLCTFPRVSSLTVSPSMTTPPLSSVEDAATTLCGGIQKFRDLQKITLPLELTIHLKPVLLQVLSLPHCRNINFTASSTFILTPEVIPVLVAALKDGFAGVRHVSEVNLPRQLKNHPDIVDLLGGAGDLAAT
ncbi:hypothetical protein C8J56DRAFT_539528 [Mycena floridula]|nr:hypothetical protein C8J56DRAFT_539528 [Mycena floridula]